MDAIRSAAEAVFHQESGRILAFLIRISGSFDRAEEAMQEAFASALVRWHVSGIPQNPGAWITIAAQRKLIDFARRERTRRVSQDAIAYETSLVESEHGLMTETSTEIPDDRLRLMFTCCHPALNREAQIALTLRTLGGLSTREIAKAFLLPEETLAQRVVRAKRKIQEARIPYEVPPRDRLPERLQSLQAVIYLIFNEGYAASSGDRLVRGDLCSEAIRLGRLLCELLPMEPENPGLLALMLLHDSRRDARTNQKGELVTLEEQDRSLWDRRQIAEGRELVRGAQAGGYYRLQAAIAAQHAQARTPEETDWRRIARLYESLLEINRSAVVALNCSVAVAMGEGIEKGMAMIDELGRSGELNGYYLFHAARADLLRRLQRWDEAASAYSRALDLAVNPIEQNYLRRRLADLRK